MALSDLASDRARALALTPVSRETIDRLDRFATIVSEWQGRMNLIAPSTEPILWSRHIADSLQLLPLVPEARTWVDLGSGAGFPGLVVACALADFPNAQVHLVESTQKKASFLREAAKFTGAPAVVHAERIADFIKGNTLDFDVVTARALAPLPKLLAEAYPLLKMGAIGLFHKGQDVGIELTDAAKCWTIQASLVPSRTASEGRIVVINGIAHRRDTRPLTT